MFNLDLDCKKRKTFKNGSWAFRRLAVSLPFHWHLLSNLCLMLSSQGRAFTPNWRWLDGYCRGLKVREIIMWVKCWENPDRREIERPSPLIHPRHLISAAQGTCDWQQDCSCRPFFFPRVLRQYKNTPMLAQLTSNDKSTTHSDLKVEEQLKHSRNMITSFLMFPPRKLVCNVFFPCKLSNICANQKTQHETSTWTIYLWLVYAFNHPDYSETLRYQHCVISDDFRLRLQLTTFLIVD